MTPATVVETLSDRLAAGDLSALDDLVAEDLVNHAAGPQGRLAGAEIWWLSTVRPDGRRRRRPGWSAGCSARSPSTAPPAGSSEGEGDESRAAGASYLRTRRAPRCDAGGEPFP